MIYSNDTAMYSTNTKHPLCLELGNTQKWDKQFLYAEDRLNRRKAQKIQIE